MKDIAKAIIEQEKFLNPMNNEQEPTKDVNKLAEEKYPYRESPYNSCRQEGFIAGYTAREDKTASMKWVSVKDKMPDKIIKTIVKYFDDDTHEESAALIRMDGSSTLLWGKYTITHWLDESTPVSDAAREPLFTEQQRNEFAKRYLNWAEQNYYRSGKYEWTSHVFPNTEPRTDDEVLDDYLQSLTKQEIK